MEFEIDMSEFQRVDLPSIKDNIVKIKDYFGTIPISLEKLQQNFNKQIFIYVGPFYKYGGRIMCTSTEKKIELYIDKDYHFYMRNVDKNHELLHAACESLDDGKNYFGHNEKYIGIDEATTQLFAEEIEGIELQEDESYLWFITNVMRVNKIIFGLTCLADQYLNGTSSFESKFNSIVPKGFEMFAQNMTTLYHLLRRKKYNGISDAEEEILINKENEMIEYLKNVIAMCSLNDTTVYERIQKSLVNSKFMNLLYSSSTRNKR